MENIQHSTFNAQHPLAEAKQCPICGDEFIPRAQQRTCGKRVCTKKHCLNRASICECGGVNADGTARLKVGRRGCVECNARDDEFFGSETALRKTRRAREEAEARELRGLSRWAKKFTAYAPDMEFNPAFPLS